MSFRSLVRRTQLLLDQALYESREAMRSMPETPGLEMIALEERILLSATPAALVADAGQSAESTVAVESAPSDISTDAKSDGPDHDQLFELAASSILPVADPQAETNEASDQ